MCRDHYYLNETKEDKKKLCDYRESHGLFQPRSLVTFMLPGVSSALSRSVNCC